jgi:FMN hydrolase / 5-amino-6-(5-phospho-D-ribitylamino)uracil phosphatase
MNLPVLDLSKIKAISLDLDDTLWPIWPIIDRAEKVLHNWLAAHAPGAARLAASPAVLRELRMDMNRTRPDLANDMSALRRESIRLLLARAEEDTTLAEPAFEAFFAERQRVDFYADALPALDFLSARYPLVAISNGNADVQRVGLGRYFAASFSAHLFGEGKPHPRIFHAAAASVGVTPEQVLHIGDDPHLDAVGGLNAGMQVAWLNRDGALWTHDPLQPHVTVAGLGELCAQLG